MTTTTTNQLESNQLEYNQLEASLGREGKTPLLPRFFTRRARAILLVALLCLPVPIALPVAAFGQTVTSYPVFRAYNEASKSSAAEVFVLQLPPRAGKRAELHSLTLYCSADVNVTIEVNGGGSTSTEFSTSILNQQGVTSVAKAYHSSNSTAGTSINKFGLFGDSTLTLDLTNTILPSGQSTVKNFIVRTSAFTGTIRYSLTWAER